MDIVKVAHKNVVIDRFSLNHFRVYVLYIICKTYKRLQEIVAGCVQTTGATHALND